MQIIIDYFKELSQTVTDSWSQFWFVKTDSKLISLLRIPVGSIALLYVLLFTPGMVDWFAADGILPVAQVYRLTGIASESSSSFYWSLFYFTQSPTEIWIAHLFGIASVSCFLLGVKTRFSTPIALFFVLSYTQRAPMLVGLLEPILCPVMFYLCFAPAGDYFSIDAFLRKNQDEKTDKRSSLGANIALRLIQVHLSMFYGMMAVSKLGSYTWWGGEAMWLMIAQNHSPMIDFRFLRENVLLIHSWTHFVVLFELCFALLIWVKIFRPLLIALSFVHWAGLSLVTGQWEFGLMMCCLNLVFFAPELIASFFPESTKQAETISKSVETITQNSEEEKELLPQ